MRAWGLVLWLLPVVVFGRAYTAPAATPDDKLA
jgi:hypothetical protein